MMKRTIGSGYVDFEYCLSKQSYEKRHSRIVLIVRSHYSEYGHNNAVAFSPKSQFFLN